jgi:hypothetical protein
VVCHSIMLRNADRAITIAPKRDAFLEKARTLDQA